VTRVHAEQIAGNILVPITNGSSLDMRASVLKFVREDRISPELTSKHHLLEPVLCLFKVQHNDTAMIESPRTPMEFIATPRV
jgi:hypothetical protein